MRSSASRREGKRKVAIFSSGRTKSGCRAKNFSGWLTSTDPATQSKSLGPRAASSRRLTLGFVPGFPTRRSQSRSIEKKHGSLPVTVSKILIRRYAVPHQLLQLLQFRKSPFLFARENDFPIQSDFKHRVGARNSHYLADFLL